MMLLGTRKNRVNPTSLSDADLIKKLLDENTSGRDQHKIRKTLAQRAAQRGW